MNTEFDAIVIGAGAAGMMSGAIAGQRGLKVLVVDHAKKIGEKIRISGGGRCNFTNIHTTDKNFLSENRHFCKSALSRYQPRDFIDLIEKYGIAWHEKAKGQLFCDESAAQIVAMLQDELAVAKVALRQGVVVQSIAMQPSGFVVETTIGTFLTQNVVIACGGKSIPKIGASGFGFDVARQFGLTVVETAPALVPLTFANEALERFKTLAGVAVPVRISCNGAVFDEDLLFTHRGLSGPAVLQISSFWREKQGVCIHFMPEIDFEQVIIDAKHQSGRQGVGAALAGVLPKRLAAELAQQFGYAGNVADMNRQKIAELAVFLAQYTVYPTGTEGYRTAEVTRGGVDTNMIDAKTMQAKSIAGLYFIGEVVDVTGWLGGYNFQWAWASGYAAGMAIELPKH